MLENTEIASCNYQSVVCNNFLIDQPFGPGHIAFVHFYKPMKILVDGKIIDIKGNAFFFIEKGTPQYYYPLDGIMCENWMHFNNDCFYEFLAALGIPINRPFWIENSDDIDLIFRELSSNFHAKELYWKEICNLKFKHMLYKISAGLKLSRNFLENRIGYSDFITLRINMSNSLEHPWTIYEMAEKLNYSVSHFCFKYKEIFGISPKQDLILKRIERAKYLLNSSLNSVELISQILCYETSTSFIAIFTKHVGISPSRYRNNKHI